MKGEKVMGGGADPSSSSLAQLITVDDFTDEETEEESEVHTYHGPCNRQFHVCYRQDDDASVVIPMIISYSKKRFIH